MVQHKFNNHTKIMWRLHPIWLQPTGISLNHRHDNSFKCPFSFANVVEPSSISELPITAMYSSHAKNSSLFQQAQVSLVQCAFLSMRNMLSHWCSELQCDIPSHGAMIRSTDLPCRFHVEFTVRPFYFLSSCFINIELCVCVGLCSRNMSCMPRCRFNVLNMHL